MNNIATSNTFTQYVMWSLKTVLFSAVFFVATFTLPLFAQETLDIKQIQEPQLETKEVVSEEMKTEELTPATEETQLISEPELSKEQQKQLKNLDKLLRKEKIIMNLLIHSSIGLFGIFLIVFAFVLEKKSKKESFRELIKKRFSKIPILKYWSFDSWSSVYLAKLVGFELLCLLFFAMYFIELK